MRKIVKDSRCNSDKTGFTLIELLIVVSIISLLAAILFPVFARARENARRASCMSNMKQLGLAFMMYTQDYDEQLPINGNYNATSRPSTHSWDVCIAPYSGVKVQTGLSPAIFRCPSDTSADTFRSYAMPYRGQATGGLAKAIMVLGYDDELASMVGVKLVAIPEPSRTIMLTEHPSSAPGVRYDEPTFVNNNFGKYADSYVNGPSGPAGTANVQDTSRPGNPIHLEGWNYLFCDGHVKWMKPEQTLGGAESAVGLDPGNLWRRIKDTTTY